MSGGDSKSVHKCELQCMGAELAQRDQVIGELTVIDYYLNYLLSCNCTPSHQAQDLNVAPDEAKREVQRLCGRLQKVLFSVTDN